MGCVYLRGNRLWIKYKDENGEWAYESTKLPAGEEKKAKKILRSIEKRFEATTEFKERTGIDSNPTVREFGTKHWIPERRALGIEDWKNDASRLRDHVYPYIGDMRLDQPVQPRHIVHMVNELRKKPNIAPKTVRNIYSLAKALFRDAQILGLVDHNPCILTKQQLGPCEDKDPEWRPTAIFKRAELEALIADPRIPWDRQVHYALKGIAALREGEADGLRWRHFEQDHRPLGRLVIATSYNKGRTKTGQTRYMPVHPSLAAMLAEWKLKGWPEMMGRNPGPDDLIVPLPASRRVDAGTMRTKCHSYKRLKRDLKELGLRHRRGHDLRRTMISLAISDGARKDLLKLCTHGPPRREGIDAYITIGWEPLCAEVARLKVSRRPRGEVIEMPRAVAVGDWDEESPVISSERVTVELQSKKKASDVAGLESGGAGSRTRVRKCSIRASTSLSGDLNHDPARPPEGSLDRYPIYCFAGDPTVKAAS